MQVQYFRSTWGIESPSLEDTLRSIQKGGFDGVEMAVPVDGAARKKLASLLADLGLSLIAQIYTAGQTPDEHARSLEDQYLQAVELRPGMINAHTGKDFFTIPENAAIFRRAAELAEQTGIPVAHEIHRGRATFCAPVTMALMDALPNTTFTADLSHWCCVHESMLQDQAESVERVIQNTRHIHARVGYPEGPQVNDPRAPEWRDALETHLGWWQRIADCHRQRRTALLTITPEFGPPAYMPTLPFTRQPVADLWEVNIYMRDLLKERLVV